MKIWKALCMSFWMTPLVCKTGDQQMAVKAKFHLLAFKVMCTWETDCATKLCQKRCPYTFRNRFRFAKHLEKRSLDFCPHWIRMCFLFPIFVFWKCLNFYLFSLLLWLFCRGWGGDWVVSCILEVSVQEYFLISHMWGKSFYAWSVCLTMGYVLGWFFM